MDDNQTVRLLSIFNGHDIHLLKQVCDVEGVHLLLKIVQGRVELKANGVFLLKEDRKQLTAKLRYLTEYFTDRTVHHHRDGSIRRPAERKSGLYGTMKLFLSEEGGIDRTRYIFGTMLIENGWRKS